MNLEKFASHAVKAQAAVDKIIAEHTSPATAGASPGTAPGAGELATTRPRSEPALKSVNSMPFINRTNIRNFLLEHAKATRPHNKFNRVSEETLRDIHESVRQMLIARVHRTPSKGRTM
jgi:hypothetical protein